MMSLRRTLPVVVVVIAGVATGACDRRPNPGAAQSAAEPAPTPWFEESARKHGLDFVHRSGFQPPRHLFPETVCGGAALLDIDNDGDLDASLIQSGWIVPPDDPGAPRPTNRLFRNRGEGAFEEITAGSGADIAAYGMGAATGDVDNDGDVDLYLTNLGANVLLRNDGPTGDSHRFTDITASAGVGDERWSAGAAFLDFDADGDLDLYVANYIDWSLATERECVSPAGAPDYCSPRRYAAPARDTLYRNEGDGTFTDITIEAGMAAAAGNGLGVVCGDFNGDHRLDIFVANDATLNHLWINQGGGRFIDQAVELGCARDSAGLSKAGMGVAAADVDDDADLDLLVVNLQGETDSLFRNEMSSARPLAGFSDVTARAGLGSISRGFTRFGAGLHDFNCDGWLDLYEANGRVLRHSTVWSDDPFAEPNLLFRGADGGRFEEVIPRGGTAELLVATSRAAAFGDLDNDGGIDIVVVNRDGPTHLLRNIAPARGRWIGFRALEAHGRDALGATLTIRAGPRTLTRDVRSASSYSAANDPRVHVGLGDFAGPVHLTVHWVGGDHETFGPFEPGQYHTVRRGSGASR
jgi:hypothetical protein